MFKYMSYLFVLIRKRLSTYLIPFFAAAVSCVLMYLAFKDSRPNGQGGVGNLSPFFLFIPFIFGGLFTGVKALNIFKDGEIDGTELLIASKQITRTQLVFGKFGALYTIIIGYNIIMFVATFGIGFTDQYASVSDILKFSGSFAVGGLIIMVLMAAVIAFFASFLGKIGTMTLSIVIPALLPIVSFTINPLGNGTLDLGSSDAGRDKYFFASFLKENSKKYSTATNAIYTLNSSNMAEVEQSVNDQSNGWYKYASYIDIYQHLNRFYNVFYDRTILPSTQAAEWKYVSKDLEGEGADFILDNKGDKTFYSIDKNVAYNGDIITGVKLLSNINFDKFDEWLDINKTKFNGNNNFQLTMNNFEKIIEDENILSIIGVPDSSTLEELAPEILSVRTYSKLTNDGTIGKADEVKWDNAEDHIISFANKDTKFLEGKDYISTTSVISIYIVITILLSGLVIFRYYRRDFK